MSFKQRESQANQGFEKPLVNNNDTPKKKTRSGWKTKRYAERSFDAFAAPKSLMEFVSDLNPERPFKFTFVEEQYEEIAIKEIKKEEPIENIEFKIASSISVARRISPIEDVPEYNLDLLFIEPVEQFVDKILDNKRESTDFNLEPQDLEQQRSEKLFQAAQGLQQVMPELTNLVLKPKESLESDSKNFHDNEDGINKLRTELLNYMKTDQYFTTFLKDYEKRDVFNDDSFLVQYSNNKMSTNILACFYVLEKVPHLLNQRTKKIRFLGNNGSSEFISPNLTVESLFKAINVRFYGDLFDNPSWDSQVPKLAAFYFRYFKFTKQYFAEEELDHDFQRLKLEDTACPESDFMDCNHQPFVHQVVRSDVFYQQMESRYFNFLRLEFNR
jgi:hypothetical protein